MKPNLFIVGAPKCGTTAWSRYLGAHPDIYFSKLKEPHFFARDLSPNQQIRSARDYEQLFSAAGDSKIVAEASAMYLYSRTAAQGIHDYNPDARILIFLRDQHDFLRSWHQQMMLACQEPVGDFGKAWRLSGRRETPKECVDAKLLDYAALARFPEQVERFFKLFPAEQIRLFHFDKWTKDPRSTYLKILAFLGLSDDGQRDFPLINGAKSHGNRWLVRKISNPPQFAVKAATVVKKLTGKPSLGIGEFALNALATRGYDTESSDELREEIGNYYKGDNDLLNARICDPARSG